MPGFDNVWFPGSVDFFNKAYSAWLKGSASDLVSDLQVRLASTNASQLGLFNKENPFVATAILFGDIGALRLLKGAMPPLQEFTQEANQVRDQILELAFHCHGEGEFFRRVQNVFNVAASYLPSRRQAEYQKILISRYKAESMFSSKIYIESMCARLNKMFDLLVADLSNPQIAPQIIELISEISCPQILGHNENEFIRKAIDLQNIAILAAFLRIPSLNVDTVTVNSQQITTLNYIDEHFPRAAEIFENRQDLQPFPLQDLRNDFLPFSEIKKQSLKAQFEKLQNFYSPENTESIIEQVRFIERHASDPVFISSLIPSILAKQSRFVLTAALMIPDLNLSADIANRQSMVALRRTWSLGYNLILSLARRQFSGYEVMPRSNLLTPAEKETALFVLDHYFPSEHTDNLPTNEHSRKIKTFLQSLVLIAEPPNSDLFNKPRLLQRLVAFAIRVADARLAALVYEIPAVRRWRSGDNTLLGANLFTELIRLLPNELRAVVLSQDNFGHRDIRSAQQLDRLLDLAPEAPIIASNIQQAPQQAPTPEPTKEQLCQLLRECILTAEKTRNQLPLLNFIKNNKAPEIYNHFPMPRHSIFILMHYLMHHQNVEILSALLDIQGLEYQGIGPYNETMHQFFARYFGPVSKTPWAEGVALVNEKIPAITVVEESQPEFKARTLIQATMLGDIELVRQCLKLSPNPQTVNFANPHSKETALMIAVKNKDIEMIKVLVTNKNCDVNIKDLDGNTAYMLAAKEGQREIIEILNVKADITINNRSNQDAAQLAGMNGHRALAEHLARLIQDANIQNEKMEVQQKLKKEYVEQLDEFTKRMHVIGKLDDFPSEYLDPVTGKIMMNPICLPDGWTFDHSTLLQMITDKKMKNSMSGQDFPAGVLNWKPNQILMKKIEDKVIKYENAHAAKQPQNQDDDNDVNDKVVNDPSSRA